MSEVVLTNVRLSYVAVWEPKPNLAGQLKYSASIMVEKSNEAAMAICNKAVSDAINGAVTSGKISKAKSAIVLSPLRDGDKEVEVEKKTSDYAGFMFFNAYSDNRPSVVDEYAQPIFNQDEIYSGCWTNVAVSFYFTDKGGEPRVAVGLNHIMKTGDDDRLDGRTNVTDAFAAYIKQRGDESPELV